MNYKTLLPSRDLRLKILRLFDWVPDTLMVRFQYIIHFGGRILHLRKPVRYTEKIQHYKCFYRNPIMGQCVDKYAVREYIKSLGCEVNLIKLIASYNPGEDIDFDMFPNKFVIKTNDSGASLGVLICRDKNTFDRDRAKEIIKSWTNARSGHLPPGREWAYSQIKAQKIVVEEYLDNPESETESPNDYKIMCFDGKVQYFWVETERTIGMKRNFFDRDCNPLDLKVIYDPNPNYKLPNRAIIKELFDFAEKLSAPFPHVRVDLYYTNKPIFGELTFYTDSGYGTFEPDSFDFELGSKFNIDYKEYNLLKK